MIASVSNIASEDPSREIWKNLRFFLNSNRTAKRIRELLKVPEGQHQANINKQADQIGYCIRQAEEYFNASSRVSLATRPLLLYYGCVSLSQALILLNA